MVKVHNQPSLVQQELQFNRQVKLLLNSQQMRPEMLNNQLVKQILKLLVLNQQEQLQLVLKIKQLDRLLKV